MLSSIFKVLPKMGKRRPQGTVSLLLYFPTMQTVMPLTRLQLLGKRHPVDIAFHGGDTGSNPVGGAIFNDLPETNRGYVLRKTRAHSFDFAFFLQTGVSPLPMILQEIGRGAGR